VLIVVVLAMPQNDGSVKDHHNCNGPDLFYGYEVHGLTGLREGFSYRVARGFVYGLLG